MPCAHIAVATLCFSYAQQRRSPYMGRLSPHCTASTARTVRCPKRGWCRPPTGTYTGRRGLAGPTAMERVFKITPSGTLTMIYSFCQPPSGCYGRCLPLRGADPGHRRRLLRDNLGRRGQRPWDGFQNQPKRHADHAAQLLLGKRLRGRPISQRGAGPGRRRGFLRDNVLNGGANGFGTVFKITPSGALTTLHSFCSQSGCTDGTIPRRGAGPGHRWELLRDNVRGRGLAAMGRSSKSPQVAR